MTSTTPEIIWQTMPINALFWEATVWPFEMTVGKWWSVTAQTSIGLQLSSLSSEPRLNLTGTSRTTRPIKGEVSMHHRSSRTSLRLPHKQIYAELLNSSVSQTISLCDEYHDIEWVLCSSLAEPDWSDEFTVYVNMSLCASWTASGTGVDRNRGLGVTGSIGAMGDWQWAGGIHTCAHAVQFLENDMFQWITVLRGICA